MHSSCFSPRTPCGVRPAPSVSFCTRTWFQSTHSLRSATWCLANYGCTFEVSIHALLAECDQHRLMVPAQQRVSIHALLAECDHIRCGLCPGHSSFNPRTPCGVRPSFRGRWWRHTRFQSTHSLRSATFDTLPVTYQDTVSIHALLAECDRIPIPLSPYGRSFNPRTPCGVRPSAIMGSGGSKPFQSTHSLRSATVQRLHYAANAVVSIHALLAECDCVRVSKTIYPRSFNPRTPCGVRRIPAKINIQTLKFQSTHSLRSATNMEDY